MSQNPSPIDWAAIESPALFRGDHRLACRDPTVHYHDGLFRAWFSLVDREPDGRCFWYTAVSRSEDLIHWSEPELITPRDQSLNYSSPGNVIRFGDKWLLCLQTYPTPGNEVHGTADARIFVMESDNLETWGYPRLLRVKGPKVPCSEMGRMIDPYLVEDKDEPGKWWCFYKQRGASMSYSYDLETWTYFGRVDSGENVCVLVEGGEYVLIHAPKNGVGIKRSRDLVTWSDHGVMTLGQEKWPWAQGRLTAAYVLDLRDDPCVGRYVMFFHGCVSRSIDPWDSHGQGSLALAWSDDLMNWEWPGK
jgi:hypothetical protein